MGFTDIFKKKHTEQINSDVIDNFNQIKSLLTFEDKDDFYFCQIIQRKKDGNDVPASNNGYRTIRTYYIKSPKDLDRLKPHIIQLCEHNRARAYINLNVRNAKEVLLAAIQYYAQLIAEGRAIQGLAGSIDHCCGVTPKMSKKRKWIVDVDTKIEKIVSIVKNAINLCRSANKVDDLHYSNIFAEIPTMNGVHLITCGFDKSSLKTNMLTEAFDTLKSNREIDMPDTVIDEICGSIKKDNPTLLYFKKKKEEN